MSTPGAIFNNSPSAAAVSQAETIPPQYSVKNAMADTGTSASGPTTGSTNPQGTATVQGGTAPNPVSPATSTSTTANPNPTVSASSLSSNFQQNILNNYSTFTYYFNLFMLPIPLMNITDPAAVLSSSYGKIILAETGATGLNIKNVEIQAAVGPNFRGMNTTAGTVTIELVEPAGLTFYDQIYNAATTLGIPNYFTSPMYLGLKFQGFTDTYPQTGSGGAADNDVGGRVWIWPIQIKNIDSNFADGFGHYTLHGVIYNEIAESEMFGRLTNTFSAPVTKLTDFFDIFTQFLKFSEYEYRLAALGLAGASSSQVPLPTMSQIPTDNFKIQLHTESWDTPFTDLSLRYSSDDKTQPKRAGSYSAVEGITMVEFAKDTTIRDVLNSILMSNPFLQDLANRSTSKNSDSGGGASPSEIYSQIWRIEVETEVNSTDYDWVHNDYTRSYTYHIYNYKSTRPVLFSEFGSSPNPAASPAVTGVDQNYATAAVTDLQTRNFLVKRYDYFYTGLNTEILSFDVQINYMWAAIQPIYEGNRTYANNTIGEFKSNLAQKRGQLAYLIDKINTDQQTLKNPELDPATAAAIQQSITGEQAQVAALLNAQSQAVSSHAALLQPPTLTKAQYAVDLVNNLATTPPVPITLSPETISSEQTQHGVENTWTRGKTLLAAVLNQLNGLKTADLMNIEMEIRGDIYWLANTVYDPTYYSIPMGTSQTSTPTVPYYRLGEHGFVLIFKFPQGYDADGNLSFTQANLGNGSFQTASSTVINAIYYTQFVTHKFVDGKFTQVLKATRDPLININGVIT